MLSGIGSAKRGESVDTKQDTQQKLLKALVVLDSRENSWFLNGGFHESIDCHLMDVKSLPVNMEDQLGTLALIAEQRPDVLLLDSTLARSFVLSMVIQVRDKMPGLPVVLLPDIHDALEQTAVLPDGARKHARSDAGTDNGLDSCLIAADTISRTIRYTHGQLGLQHRLLQMALRDDLTGLHNRRGFTALATRHLRWARDTRQPMAMFFGDLDGLKSINDRFGHAEGDRAISLAAACIKETFRKFDVTARLSGDEFVALITEVPGRSVETISRRLQKNLADRSGGERRYALSLSVGVAHFDPDNPVTLQELMRRADAALYRHKRRAHRVLDAITAANPEATARAGGGVMRSGLGEPATAGSRG
jgi:two-component system cell cycle response regulator